MTGSPTTIRVKVWRVGTTEPAAWDLQVTDSSSGLQSAGRVGMRGYVYAGTTGRVTTFDNYYVTNLATGAVTTGDGQVPVTAAAPATFRFSFVTG